MERTSLTPEQKLFVLSLKYYSHLEWKIKKGDYYTSCRNDLELYQIVDKTEYEIITRRCNEPNEVINWTVWTSIAFYTNFHDYRCFVPEFVFDVKSDPDLPVKFADWLKNYFYHDCSEPSTGWMDVCYKIDNIATKEYTTEYLFKEFMKGQTS